MIGFWIVVVLTVKAVLDDHRPGTSRTPDLAQVLKVRLARGEIDAEEYLRVERVLHPGHRANQPNPRDHRVEP